MENTVQLTPLELSPLTAAWLLLFRPEDYVPAAIAHSLAVALKKPDLLSAFSAGTFPPADWEPGARANLLQWGLEVRSGLIRSFGVTLIFILLGFTAAFAVGSLDPELPISWSKVFSVIGGGLAAWATLFELGGYVATISGEAAHEIARPALFKLIFLPGLAIAALGQVL